MINVYIYISFTLCFMTNRDNKTMDGLVFCLSGVSKHKQRTKSVKDYLGVLSKDLLNT